MHLGQPRAYFADKVDEGNSILRVIHYPPLVKPGEDAGAALAKAGHVRATAHEDINLITLLLGADEGGLELLRRDGRWMEVHLARFSTPFFLHPNPDFVIETLETCVTPDRPNRYPEPITSDAYLQERLRAIKLK